MRYAQIEQKGKQDSVITEMVTLAAVLHEIFAADPDEVLTISSVEMTQQEFEELDADEVELEVDNDALQDLLVKEANDEATTVYRLHNGALIFYSGGTIPEKYDLSTPFESPRAEKWIREALANNYHITRSRDWLSES